MIIQSTPIPHRWRNRFLRDANSNFSMGGSNAIANYSNTTNNSEGNTFEPHYLWGQYFDDTEDIDGDLISTGKIQGVTIQGEKGIFDDLRVNGLANISQLEVISGYIETLLSQEITCDYLTVTKAAHFFKLIIDEIKATQGAIIITPANAKLDRVDSISGGWRCYYRAKDKEGGQIYNCFEVNDQVVCQTFDAATGTSYNVSNHFYWRKVIRTGTTTITVDGETWDAHYFDLSSSDCATSSMTPTVGDNCVQLGNRTDTTRQAAIIISAYNSQFLDKGITAPSIVQYAGINDYNLSVHRLNIISNGLNQFKGSYKNNSGNDLETIISNGDTALNNTINTLSGNVNTSISALTTALNTFSDNFNTYSSNTNVSINALTTTVSSHTESISLLQQTDSSLTSAISAHTDQIGTISGNVTLNTTQIGTISGDVATNSTKIADVSGTVTSHTNSISVLQQTAISLSSTISGHTDTIASLSGTVYNQGTAIGTINGTLSAHTTSISNLEQSLTGLSSTVSSHTTTLTTLGNQVATIRSDYVTSSQLTQASSSIKASVLEEISYDAYDISSTGVWEQGGTNSETSGKEYDEIKSASNYDIRTKDIYKVTNYSRVYLNSGFYVKAVYFNDEFKYKSKTSYLAPNSKGYVSLSGHGADFVALIIRYASGAVIAPPVAEDAKIRLSTDTITTMGEVDLSVENGLSQFKVTADKITFSGYSTTVYGSLITANNFMEFKGGSWFAQYALGSMIIKNASGSTSNPLIEISGYNTPTGRYGCIRIRSEKSYGSNTWDYLTLTGEGFQINGSAAATGTYFIGNAAYTFVGGILKSVA